MLRSRDHKRFFGWVWIVWSCSAAQDENRNIWNGFNMGTSMWTWVFVSRTVTSDTQTGLDCWWRILSFRVSYQWWEPGCRSTRAEGGEKEEHSPQWGGRRWREKKQFVGNYFVSGVLYVNAGTREEVAAVFPQFEGLCVEAPGALVGVCVVHLPHWLHVLATVGVQEQNHRVVLDVVQPLHCSGSDVQ